MKLINHKTNNRIAEGLPESNLIDIIKLPSKRIKNLLEHFTSSSSRLLEKLPDGNYRIAHETFISPLQGIAGLLLAKESKIKEMF